MKELFLNDFWNLYKISASNNTECVSPKMQNLSYP